MTETARTRANRQNAQRSTGPSTPEGKAVAAQNARRHGLLSRELILPDEAPDEFALLLEELQRDWRPVGITENLLIERVATALWRQRRLVRVETAEIQLHQAAGNPPHPSDLAKVMERSGYDMAQEVIAQESLPLLANHQLWDAALSELQFASLPDECPTFSELHACVPETAKAVAVLAQYHGQSPDAWLAMHIADHEDGYHRGLLETVRLERFRWNYLPLKQHMLALRSIPLNSERLSRYQSALDNDLYKALRELRVQQSYRQSVMKLVVPLEEASPG